MDKEKIKEAVKLIELDWKGAGKVLFEMRNKLGLSTYDVADLSGVSKSQVWFMEQGKPSSLTCMIKVCEAYNKMEKSFTFENLLKVLKTK